MDRNGWKCTDTSGNGQKRVEMDGNRWKWMKMGGIHDGFIMEINIDY